MCCAHQPWSDALWCEEPSPWKVTAGRSPLWINRYPLRFRDTRTLQIVQDQRRRKPTAAFVSKPVSGKFFSLYSTTNTYIYQDTIEWWERKGNNCRLSVFIPLLKCSLNWSSLGLIEKLLNRTFSHMPSCCIVSFVNIVFQRSVKVCEWSWT